VDDQFNQLFKTETLVGKLAGVFCFSCHHHFLFGFIWFISLHSRETDKRNWYKKSIGRINGWPCRVAFKDFIKLVFIACVIAFPLAWWMMHDWLQDFEYRVQIHWWIFIAAGLLAGIIALVTVSFQAIRVALANPAKSLRTE
jgi:hypothetical protein